jgi:hypothetical protein
LGELQRDSIDKIFEVKTRDYTEERFSRFISGSNSQYLQAWKDLESFAYKVASSYFHDSFNKDEAVEDTMTGEKDSVINFLVKIRDHPEELEKIKNPWGYIKSIIVFKLYKLSGRRKPRKSLKRDKIIALYLHGGFSNAEIVRKVGCTKARVTQVLKEVKFPDS